MKWQGTQPPMIERNDGQRHHISRPGKLNERAKIVIVCGAQGGDVGRSKLADIMQRATAPAEGLLAKALDKKVCHEPRVAPIAVGKGMDSDEAVMEPDSDLIRWKGRVIDPVADVVEHYADVVRDPMRLDANVPLCQPIGAGPSPDVAEHPLVQRFGKIGAEHVTVPLPPAPRPYGALHDILLLGLVEIAARRDPGLLQAETFFGFQRCCVVGFLEEISHGWPTSRGL